ncbi:hypothetical protein PtrV1_11367 [Pyrenophora tritici-repentis]|nr:hypothetical protein PtrV1_11363 [Pyrenophora tritici-repentis]KAA8615971.1 hypothetical protein PtrV1_11367 [Pyrenophora tritici-repentis]
MPDPRHPRKRPAAAPVAAAGRSKRQKGSKSQPITIEASQPSHPFVIDEDTQRETPPTSPRRAILAASQGVDFEMQLRDSIPEDAIVAPVEASEVAAAASEAVDEGEPEPDFDPRMADNFDGINWSRLPRYMKPLRTQKQKKSWVYNYGYRLTLRSNTNRIFWLCHICHKRKAATAGFAETTEATSTAARHLNRDHGITNAGEQPPQQLLGGQKSLEMMLKGGFGVSQRVANEIGNFDVQSFRIAAVSWLVDNNLALCQFEDPAFRRMIHFANPEAEQALWSSRTSVAQFVMRLYNFMQPQVVDELRCAASKIHISFDGWTVKGGKRGFFGIVAHFATAEGDLRDVAIDLPQLSGAHTGDRIADCVAETLQKFNITAQNVGYFMLDNAFNNDTAIATLGAKFGFKSKHRRLRCSAHTINLVGQSIIFGSNKDAFNNDENLAEEEKYLNEWRKQGPLGTLIDVISYIKTPQQYDMFANFQRLARQDLPADDDAKFQILEPVKPCVTRWNSFCSAFERAVLLQPAFNSYVCFYVEQQRVADSHARTKNNKKPQAPAWMRSKGLTAADWAVITEYIEVLKPLKDATKRLEGRGKCGRFGAIYEVIPVFEFLMGRFEQRLRQYERVDFEQREAPEDHISINFRAAWEKLNDYYSKLDDSPAYFAACALHPYYRRYCEKAWRDKPEWLVACMADFRALWAEYTTSTPPTKPSKERDNGAIDEAISYIISDSEDDDELTDEYDRWRKLEPKWTSKQHNSPNVDGNPIKYWVQLQSKYPDLSRFAIDVLSIPASSCDGSNLRSLTRSRAIQSRATLAVGPCEE